MDIIKNNVQLLVKYALQEHIMRDGTISVGALLVHLENLQRTKVQQSVPTVPRGNTQMKAMHYANVVLLEPKIMLKGTAVVIYAQTVHTRTRHVNNHAQIAHGASISQTNM